MVPTAGRAAAGRAPTAVASATSGSRWARGGARGARSAGNGGGAPPRGPPRPRATRIRGCGEPGGAGPRGDAAVGRGSPRPSRPSAAVRTPCRSARPPVRIRDDPGTGATGRATGPPARAALLRGTRPGSRPVLRSTDASLVLLAQSQRAEDLGLDPAQAGAIDERPAKESGADQHDDEDNLRTVAASLPGPMPSSASTCQNRAGRNNPIRPRRDGPRRRISCWDFDRDAAPIGFARNLPGRPNEASPVRHNSIAGGRPVGARRIRLAASHGPGRRRPSAGYGGRGARPRGSSGRAVLAPVRRGLVPSRRCRSAWCSGRSPGWDGSPASRSDSR